MLKQVLNSLLLFSVLISAPIYAAVAPAGDYVIDEAHSNVGFEVGHLGVSLVVGRFDRFAGTIKFAPNGDSNVNLSIETASINTKVEQRDRHLRSDDFFDAANFPKLTFTSQSVTYDAEGNPKTIQGNLTLHGQTNPVTLTVAALGTGPGPQGETRAGYKATTQIKRSQFGMTQLLVLAGDDVMITLHIEAIRQ